MIFENIGNAFVSVVLGIIRIFPTIPTVDLSFLNSFIRVLSLVDTFVSLRILSASIAVIFVVMNIRTIWSVIMWVVRKLPGIS